jgi:hypothetical protein
MENKFLDFVVLMENFFWNFVNIIKQQINSRKRVVVKQTFDKYSMSTPM